MKAKVFVTRRLPEEIMIKLENDFEVVCNPHDRNLTIAELRKGITDCDLIITMLADKIDENIMKLNPKIKGICNYAVGYNNIDIEAATRLKIPVCNTPGVLTETTADLAWALIFAAARRIAEADRFARAGKFLGWSPLLLQGQDIFGKKLGIIGAGRIGEAVARRAVGFNMRVLYYDHNENEFLNKNLHAEKVSLVDLLRSSDIISLHVPYNSETHHLIDTEQFELMKPTAVLVNTARGKVINEQALINALQQKSIAGAGLDVFYNEPDIPQALMDLENVVIVPHIGSASRETRYNMAELVRKCAVACIKREMPPAIVNRQVMQEY